VEGGGERVEQHRGDEEHERVAGQAQRGAGERRDLLEQGGPGEGEEEPEDGGEGGRDRVGGDHVGEAGGAEGHHATRVDGCEADERVQQGERERHGDCLGPGRPRHQHGEAREHPRHRQPRRQVWPEAAPVREDRVHRPSS